MKNVVLMFVVLMAISQAGYVNGYIRSDGTAVSGYYRSNPDGIVENNYGYKQKVDNWGM